MKWETAIKTPWLPGALTLYLLVRLATAGLAWTGVALLLVSLLWFSLALIDWLVGWRQRRDEADERMARALAELEAPPSLVLLLSEPRQATREAAERCVREALGWERDVADLLTEVAGAPGGPVEAARFLVRLPEGIFAVLLSSRPYVADPADFARASIRDKRLRKAVEEHRAWLAVDLVSAPPEEPEGRRRAYAILGKLLAAMAGPDCLAIYSPELKRCNEFDPTLLEPLRSGQPLAIFSEPTFEPVVEIEEGDPRMTAAVEEARLRWPEFAAAFRAKAASEDDRFIIKAEFSEGERVEFMWIAVSSLGEDQVTGFLMNDPHELEELHRGKQVTVDLERLNDWIYPGDDGEMSGGFTLDVLADNFGDEGAGGGQT